MRTPASVRPGALFCVSAGLVFFLGYGAPRAHAAADAVYEQLASQDAGARAEGASRLAPRVARNDPAALGALAKVLRADPEPRVRSAAVLALGAATSCQQVARIIALAWNDGSERVRVGARRAATKLRCEEASLTAAAADAGNAAAVDAALAKMAPVPVADAERAGAPPPAAATPSAATLAAPAAPLSPEEAELAALGIPGRWSLRFGMGPAIGFPLPGAAGLSVLSSTGGSGTLTLFGLDLGIGRLVGKHVEVGGYLDLRGFSISDENDSIVAFAISPYVKFNTWSTPRLNFFVELAVGVLAFSEGRDNKFFRGNLAIGIEALIGKQWGVRIWTGVQIITQGDEALIELPFRWGLVGYF